MPSCAARIAQTSVTVGGRDPIGRRVPLRDRVLATARHVEDRAGDVGRLVRDQPDDGVGNLIRGTDALHRHQMGKPMRAIGLAAGGMDIGVDQPGPDASDADAFTCDLVAEADREGIDRALGGGVVDIGVGRAELGRDRGQVDDDAALAAVPGRHPLHRLARAQDAAGDVDRHHLLDALGRHLVDAHAALADDAGIVDQRAERAEAVGGLEQRENIRLAADVAFHRDRLAVLGLDRGDDFVRRSLIGGIADHDAVAARGGCERGGAADAAAAAGDDNDLVRHIDPQT
ncbi:hypothetical protein chiPu_0028508, partial [Chiloscyllium punctatum]|nr:hypothetical protein [Chiloscyllium punctatum]